MASKFPFFTWPLIWPHMSSCYVLSVKRGQIYIAPWHRDTKQFPCSGISLHHSSPQAPPPQPPQPLFMCGLSISSLLVLLLAPHAAKPSQRTKSPQLRTLTPSGHLGQDLYTFTFCSFSEFFKYSIQLRSLLFSIFRVTCSILCFSMAITETCVRLAAPATAYPWPTFLLGWLFLPTVSSLS